MKKKLRTIVAVFWLQSCVWLFVTSWTAAWQASLSFTITEFAQNHVHWVSDGIQPSHRLLFLLVLPSVFPSIRVSSNELAPHIRWPKYWSFNFSISPSHEYSRLISFSIDYFDHLAVQGTLKSLLWHHNSKASGLQHSAFFVIQLSHLSTTIGKTIALTIQTFFSKVMSLLFNALFRFVIAFLPF